MAERLGRLMMLGLLLWTAVGGTGLAIARLRRETARLRSGVRALLAVWVAYLAVLLAVSLRQPAHLYQPGQERCFRKLCFAVTNAEEVEGFAVAGVDRERLLRLSVRVTNHQPDATAAEQGLAAYLLDGQGRRWEPVPGLGGVRLTVPVPARQSTVSTPVFRVAKDAAALRLVIAHPHWTLARLTIGDAESWLHRPAEMALPSGKK